MFILQCLPLFLLSLFCLPFFTFSVSLSLSLLFFLSSFLLFIIFVLFPCFCLFLLCLVSWLLFLEKQHQNIKIRKLFSFDSFSFFLSTAPSPVTSITSRAHPGCLSYVLNMLSSLQTSHGSISNNCDPVSDAPTRIRSGKSFFLLLFVIPCPVSKP